MYYQPEVEKGVLELSPEESSHCVKVLRHKEGDEILVTDGLGTVFSAEITDANHKKCSFRITNKQSQPKKEHQLIIAIAPTKNLDRVEWFVEKAVEIGIDAIIFYFGKHSERKKINLDRISRKALSAMKQSKQAYLPSLSLSDSFSDCLQDLSDIEQRFIAHVDSENPTHLFDQVAPGKTVAVLIGPEGDFAQEELSAALESGFIKVSLGPNRLRTETAAVAATHILNLINR